MLIFIFDTRNVKKCSGDIPPDLSGAGSAVIYPYAYVVGGFQSRVGHTTLVYRLDLQTFIWQRVPVSETENMSPRDKFATWVHEDK